MVMTARAQAVALLCDGKLISREIAALLGESPKYVQRVMLKHDLPRRGQGAQAGSMNSSWKGGRAIDRDGYVLTPAPQGHPFARLRKDRNCGRIYEHRLVMERKIGRLLLPEETVDHIDGLRLHNSPDNLRLFQSNKLHLVHTISGQVPQWSEEGLEKMRASPSQKLEMPRVDTYDRMKKHGDARLRQILLAMLSLGKDSPYLLGTSHHLEKAGISDFSRTSLERELEVIRQRYA